MEKHTTLSIQELNKRCDEVFCLGEGDEIYDVFCKDGGTVVRMLEIDSGETLFFDFVPDMSERPEALAYLLGERDSFSD